MGWILLLVLSIPMVYSGWTFVLTSLMGGDPDQMLSRRGMIALARETLLKYILWAKLPWDLLRPMEMRRIGDAGPLVILIPGFTESESIFNRFANALSRAGLGYVAYRYDTFRSDPAEEIGRLEKFLERLSRDFPERDQVLVGHSLGAILAARCRSGAAGGRKRRLVAYSAPWHGTILARLALGPCGRSLQPDSDFLASMEAPRGPQVLNIRSAQDTIVAPSQAAILPDCPEVVVTDGWGHNSLLWCEEVNLQAVEWIRAEV